MANAEKNASAETRTVWRVFLSPYHWQGTFADVAGVALEYTSEGCATITDADDEVVADLRGVTGYIRLDVLGKAESLLPALPATREEAI